MVVSDSHVCRRFRLYIAGSKIPLCTFFVRLENWNRSSKHFRWKTWMQARICCAIDSGLKASKQIEHVSSTTSPPRPYTSLSAEIVGSDTCNDIFFHRSSFGRHLVMASERQVNNLPSKLLHFTSLGFTSYQSQSWTATVPLSLSTSSLALSTASAAASAGHLPGYTPSYIWL